MSNRLIKTIVVTPNHRFVSYTVRVNHLFDDTHTDAPLLIDYRFQVTRVSHSTLQLRSRGRLSLPSFALPHVLPPLSALPRLLLPSRPHFPHPGLSSRPALSYRPSSLSYPGGSNDSIVNARR